ncbi:MAG: hypothetical protein BRC46_08880 [Cyanobacteria bacterium QS_6_48_18]|nr:MAG: hypothetical protein BRC46_08880 [Cyanobacteria bacterium QS_6_48_18]
MKEVNEELDQKRKSEKRQAEKFKKRREKQNLKEFKNSKYPLLKNTKIK